MDSSFHKLCEDGDSEAVKNALAENKEYASAVDADGRLPLHWACANGHMEIASLLLDIYPEGLNVPDAAKWTPIMIAISARKSTGIVQLLLSSRGADASIPNSTGVTCLHLASSKCCTEATRLLIERYPGLIRVRDRQGQVPLHRAAAAGCLKVVRMLLDNNAPKNVSDNLGWTALHHAIAEGHVDVALELLRAKVDTDRPDTEGKRAIDVCSDQKVRRAVLEAAKENGLSFV